MESLRVRVVFGMIFLVSAAVVVFLFSRPDINTHPVVVDPPNKIELPDSDAVALEPVAEPPVSDIDLADNALDGEAIAVLAHALWLDPMIRRGLVQDNARRMNSRTIDDVMQFDLNGDGAVVLSDVPQRLIESLLPWDFDSDGQLGAAELDKMGGLIRFQAFNNGLGGADRGLGDGRTVLELMSLDPDTYQNATDAMDQEERRIQSDQIELHQAFMSSVESLLGQADYQQFLDRFAETLITKPKELNPGVETNTVRRFTTKILSFDENGDGVIAGEELENSNDYWQSVQNEQAPTELTFWQRNLNWLDQDGDQRLQKTDVPYLTDEFFGKFDSDQNEQIDPTEFKAIRDDRLTQYMNRDVPLHRYGYTTMEPVLESMGLAGIHEDAWRNLLIEHEKNFSGARIESRNTLIEDLERVLGDEGYQGFREGFGID